MSTWTSSTSTTKSFSAQMELTEERYVYKYPLLKEHKLTEKPPGNHWHFCVKPQRILDLWRYGSHRSNSRSPPLLLSLIKHPSPSVFLSLCCWSLSLFPRLQLYFRFVNVTPQPRSEIRAPNFSHSSVCDECLRRKLNTCLSVLEIPFLSFPKHISNDLFYRTMLRQVSRVKLLLTWSDPSSRTRWLP